MNNQFLKPQYPILLNTLFISWHLKSDVIFKVFLDSKRL